MKNIRRLEMLFLLIFITSNIFSSTNKNEIVYSTNPQYPPYDWSTGKDKFEGASIDLLKMIIPVEYKLVPVTYPWVRALKLAEQGEIDLLSKFKNYARKGRILGIYHLPSFF